MTSVDGSMLTSIKPCMLGAEGQCRANTHKMSSKEYLG